VSRLLIFAIVAGRPSVPEGQVRFYCVDGGIALPSSTNVISFGEKGVA
jgi:hypothetical protein